MDILIYTLYVVSQLGVRYFSPWVSTNHDVLYTCLGVFVKFFIIELRIKVSTVNYGMQHKNYFCNFYPCNNKNTANTSRVWYTNEVMHTLKKLTVIGFGRFGQLFAGLARSHYTISVIEPDATRRSTASALGYEILDVSQAIDADIIVLAVPISSLESVVKLIAPLTKPHQLVMDVCSVKVHPARVMQTYLSHCQLIATHPMFGPDSAARG